MKHSLAVLEVLKSLEGLKLRTYKDIADYDTIGYGHVITPLDIPLKAILVVNKEINLEHAEDLLARDAKEAENAVNDLVTAYLSQQSFDALVLFTFNLGKKRLKDSTLLTKLNNEETAENIVDEMLKFIFAKSNGAMVKSAGLVKRRLIESIIFSSRFNTIDEILEKSPLKLASQLLQEIAYITSHYTWNLIKEENSNVSVG